MKPLDSPLGDVRVLDLSRVIAGPYIGRVFADLGADVIKVEPPGGDEVRQIAPKHDRGMSGFLTFANVGKRSLCVDLHQPAGVELVLDLASHCDVVLENFRPGVLESWSAENILRRLPGMNCASSKRWWSIWRRPRRERGWRSS